MIFITLVKKGINLCQKSFYFLKIKTKFFIVTESLTAVFTCKTNCFCIFTQLDFLLISSVVLKWEAYIE